MSFRIAGLIWLSTRHIGHARKTSLQRLSVCLNRFRRGNVVIGCADKQIFTKLIGSSLMPFDQANYQYGLPHKVGLNALWQRGR